MTNVIPDFNKDFVCIVDRDKPDLAAVVSSYLSRSGTYLCVFEFPIATTGKSEVDDEHIDEHVISRRRSEVLDITISNALKKLGTCEHLILAGLSEDQKSYLTFLSDYSVIEIASIEEVENTIGGYALNKKEAISCRKEEILEGLLEANFTNSKLKIDENAAPIKVLSRETEGIVFVERNEATSSVIGVNYACAISACLKTLNVSDKDEERYFKELIIQWKQGSSAHLAELKEKIYHKVAGTYFQMYEFATFFTRGIPYSLGVNNIIPITYVHLNLGADFFIFNNLYAEHRKRSDAAIVFSPLFFKNEETNAVSKYLKAKNFYVKELVGNDATTYNLWRNVEQFPYDLLHICSHGGEVKGASLNEKFMDRDGQLHTVEYDEVVSFAPNPYEELIPVHAKRIWRKFDGLVWRSAELEAKGYAHYVFADMIKALNGKPGKGQNRVPKAIVPDSCAIKCSDFIYQAMFEMTAGGHTHPIIFNNTCWSWSGISNSFLYGGARGYIGTLWAVNNNLAVDAAKTFYEKLFSGTVLQAFQEMLNGTRGTLNENIYMFWGLHFSTLAPRGSSDKSKQNVLKRLLRSFYYWHDRSDAIKNENTKKEIKRLADWHIEEIRKYFFWDYMKMRNGFSKSLLFIYSLLKL